MKTFLILAVLASMAIASIYAQCQEGDQKKEDCNNCRCVKGEWACTRKACVKPVKRETNCTPGETFKQDCNSCVCSPDGKNAVCTLRACLPK